MTEDKVEQEALKILRSLGWEVSNGPEIGPDGSGMRNYSDAVVEQWLKGAIAKLNANITTGAQEEAFKKIVRTSKPTVLLDNHDFHELLVNGVDVEYRDSSGEIRTDKVWLFDFENPENNDFVAVNQLTVIQDDYNRRPDVVLFVNGLPLCIIEIKDPSDTKATLKKAYKQLQTYKAEISSIFRFNELLVITDGIDAEAGTISADYERFTSWKTVLGDKEHAGVPMMEVLLKGIFSKERLLDIVRNYVVFEREGESDEALVKKLAGYHQYWAVNKALTATSKAMTGNHKIGVVWHTQGSGKSLSMAFLAGKLILDDQKQFNNPTIIVVTDRNDLDDQLFGTFSGCKELLRQMPKQASSRENLQELLRVESGGVIFTTNAKFFPDDGKHYPLLSDRNNIIVMADEAHRSQYNFIDGFARHIRDALPNANFIGFTGTPIEGEDKNTPAVFGDYIDIYDIEQSVEDKSTVPIYYESRLIDLDINAEMRAIIDRDFDELTKGEELTRKEELKGKWAQAEAIVGNTKRIKRIAEDIVEHFENRLSAIDGKGMIVTMSRRIAVELHNAIIEIQSEWYSKDDKQGFLKIVMSGNATDDVAWQQHIRNKQRRKELAEHMKKADSPLKLVIVCDMWLTGFDVPSLHTMYLDKPIKGHNLMQAIARINRVYKDKPGGLVVDYLGIAGALRHALSDYTVSGGKGKPTLNQEEAVVVMKQKYEIVCDLFHGFEYEKYFDATTSQQLQIILDAQEFILNQDEGDERLDQHVLELSKAFALSVPHPEALAIREDVAFFQAVNVRLKKVTDTGEKGKDDEDYGIAIRQIIDKAIAPAGVVDIFEAAGLEKPNISILSDEFLAEIRNMERKNLAVEALQRLLNDEIKAKFNTNVIKARSFAEMLERALLKYKNNTIEAAQVIEELIKIAKDIRDSDKEAESIGLTADEIAFYDALVQNGSARKVMGDKQLRDLAHILVKRVRKNVSVDWTLRASAQALLRREVKRALREYGYPPDESKLATELVLEQATLFGNEWSKA
jgi:type I restriction enzyme R subunit